jgi:serine/threonine-protein kinase
VPIAAAAGVFVLILGALGVWWLVKPGDSSSSGPTTTTAASTTEDTGTTTRRTPRTTTTAENPQSFDSKLMALLPPGYGGDACKPVLPPSTGALATVDCGPPTIPSGPLSSRYSLFADQATLDSHFQDGLKAYDQLQKCPGSDLDSPTTWHYNATADQLAGQVACGTYKGNGDVFWSNNKDLLLGDAQGPNLEDLHKWWLQFG